MKNEHNTITIDGTEYGTSQLVNCKIVAKLIGLSHRTVEGMATRRELPVRKIGRLNRYCITDILTWCNERRV